VNTPRLNSDAARYYAGTRFTYPGGMEGWVDLDILHNNEMKWNEQKKTKAKRWLKRGRRSTHCCVKCEEFLCDSCAHSHRLQRATADHLVVSITAMRRLCQVRWVHKLWVLCLIICVTGCWTLFIIIIIIIVYFPKVDSNNEYRPNSERRR